jgi:putative MFS transporter
MHTTWRGNHSRTGEARVVMVTNAASIAARLDRIPTTRKLWTMVALISAGGWFEIYGLFSTPFVGPSLIHAKILTATTQGLFATTGLASFIAAMFSGLFVGSILLGGLADRIGRRKSFMYSLLWYTVATVIMAFQNDAFGLNLWRFIAGVGLGLEIVTIDTYLAELVPKAHRGRGFAYSGFLQFTAVPTVAFLAFLLARHAPLGISGWRWIFLLSAVAAVVVFFVRLRLPESPRWLASHGRIEEAERITQSFEAAAEAEGKTLPPPAPPENVVERGSFAELWRSPYRTRTIMLVVFQILQPVGLYGFSNWVPTLLIAQGITVTHSLAYSFIIAFAAPAGPLLGTIIGDRIDRKWMIAGPALVATIAGLLFNSTHVAVLVIVIGFTLQLANSVLGVAFHNYQSELYPTRIRAIGIGFVYSWSRISAILSSFIIAAVLRDFGVPGVFYFISAAMLLIVLTIGIFGPATKNRSLEEISP